MKFFVFSDCHGYADELISALNEVGFDRNNPNHFLIGCGDYLDRGRQPQEIIQFLSPIDNKILVRGNHTDLLADCMYRGYPKSHDWYNGTAQTIIDLAPNAKTFDVACAVAYEKVKDFIDSMVNYFETRNYIFVHSWIPLKCNDNLPMHYIKNRKFEFNSDWRHATEKEWNQARWHNPYELIKQGLLPQKKLLFGHWHCSTGWAKSEGRSEFGEDAKFDPYYGDGFISIDACTAHSRKVNILVIEDGFLED